MRKPTVDYRVFRLNKINDPAYSHLKLLVGWVVYFAFYFITENLIPLENCHVIHCGLDDLIPFNELFVIPYVLWYLLVAGSLLYFLLYDVGSFKKLSIFIMITQAVAMAVYILYPSRQELRPEVFPRENVFTWIISIIYAFDTPSGILPSLHVGYSLGIASVWCKQQDAGLLWKLFIVALVILVCLSTVFIKQHSAVDVFAALPLGLLAEIILYRDYWKEKRGLSKTNSSR
ncbi:MAG: phosphatase PAP2 family protein [Clostridia bacterium]|nr:phosphatase PAP2 family protein [Clostridia bacterium]